MKLSLEGITQTARQISHKAVDGALAVARRRPELCACFGYCLTVECDDLAYFVHLPDVAHDPIQRTILSSGRLPAYDDLLRLRRRTHAGMRVLEIGSGNGIRAAYYARSLEASSLRAVAFSAADLALTRKNIVLNDGGTDLTQCEASEMDACATLMGAPADLVSLQSDTSPELLELLRPMLTVVGPHVILWESGTSGSAGVCAALLTACGYGESERWKHSQFWMPRV